MVSGFFAAAASAPDCARAGAGSTAHAKTMQASSRCRRMDRDPMERLWTRMDEAAMSHLRTRAFAEKLPVQMAGAAARGKAGLAWTPHASPVSTERSSHSALLDRSPRRYLEP